MLDYFKVERGFYVDIGAHHPFNLSNTALLYEDGWRGINIDATPGSMAEFDRHRGDEINLEVAIAREPGRRLFSCFSETSLNGFVTEDIIKALQTRGQQVTEQLWIDCLPLNDILLKHAPDRQIDLMNVDAEGLDFEIISALDMETWRPKLFLVEILGCPSVEHVQETEICQLMKQRGYELFSRLHFSCIFADRGALKAIGKWRELKTKVQATA